MLAFSCNYISVTMHRLQFIGIIFKLDLYILFLVESSSVEGISKEIFFLLKELKSRSLMLIPSGKTALRKYCHATKAFELIFCSPIGNLITFMPVLMNALPPIKVNLDPSLNFILLRFTQFSKALIPIISTEFGKDNTFKFLQLEQA